MTGGRSLDTWREFAAAVAYVADLEQPGLTVWEALAEAIRVWLDDRATARCSGDELRSVFVDLMHRTAEAGAPGGVPVGEMVEAAMSDWVRASADRLNDGRPFHG